MSLLQGIIDCFRGSRRNEYRVTEDVKAERPKSHAACRSCNQSKLTPYQSKIDNLKSNEIVYVIINKLLNHFQMQNFNLIFF
jgi:hypothetical protein